MVTEFSFHLVNYFLLFFGLWRQCSRISYLALWRFDFWLLIANKHDTLRNGALPTDKSLFNVLCYEFQAAWNLQNMV